MYDALVVGAGLAGLTAAGALEAAGWQVAVVEKARGPGGRMSTRRDGALRFDHGAQYFTARDAAFERVVARWREAGWVAPWEPRLAVIDAEGIHPKTRSPERLVGTPGMSAVCSGLAASLRDCRYRWQVRAVERDGEGWRVSSTQDETLHARRVLVTCPPEQVGALVPTLDARCSQRLAAVQMRPCWALLATLDRPLLRHFDAAFVNHGPLSWVSSQSSRPERPRTEAWVLHAGPEWSEVHLESAPERVRAALVEAAQALPGAEVSAESCWSNAVVHRWRYAVAQAPLEDRTLSLDGPTLLAAGDWICGSRVEGAWRSGQAAARRWLGA